MSANWRWYMAVLCIIVTVNGCSPGNNQRLVKKAHQKLTGLESYRCTAEIFVKGNKQPGQFKVKHWFKVPDMYRVQVVDPVDMEDKTTVFDGKRIWMYYPYIDQVFLMEESDVPDEENLFIGFFLRDLMESEEIEYSVVDKDGEKMVAIQLPVRGCNKYRFIQRLYIRSKTLAPVLLEIYDALGNVTVQVKYYDFFYNCDMNPDLFKREMIARCMLYEQVDVSELFLSSMDEARERLDFYPLEFTSDTQEFQLNYIQVVSSDNGNALVVSYNDGQKSFSIIQRLFSSEEGEYMLKGEIINMEGREIVYSEDRYIKKASWIDGSIDIRVVGTVSRKALLDIVRKIK